MSDTAVAGVEIPRVNRADLLRTLETVRPGLSPAETIEQASCFVFKDGWVVTFNDEVSCRCRLPGSMTELSGAVAADPLLRTLSNMKEDEVTLVVADGELRIRGKRKTAGIRLEHEITLPVDAVDRPDGWTPLPAGFDEAVRIVQDTAGKDEEEFLSLCIHLHPEYLESCDRFRATRYTIDLGTESAFLIRQKSLRQMVTLGMTKIGLTGNWAHFRNPSGLIYSCRRYVEDYPDLGPLLDFRGVPVTLPKGLTEAADLAGIFTGDGGDENQVTVELRPGAMRVSGSGAQGWARHTLEMPAYTGDALSFQATPALLVELVGRHKDCEIGKEKLRINGENWVYVTGLGAVTKEDKDA